MTTTKKYKIVGISDDQSTCECCWRQNLKRVIHLEDTETGHTVAFGVVCAARAQKITVKAQNAAVKAFEKEQIAAARKEIWPFKVAQIAAYNEAPNDFNDPDHYQKRKAFLDNDKRVTEYREMLAKISEKYSLPAYLMTC